MSERVTMPALGESVTEGTVTRWLKNVGDTVALDEPLLEVSTDKVDTEIPSPVAGTLQEILVAEDETVPVGADLAVIGEGATAPSESAAPAAEPPTEQAQPVTEQAQPVTEQAQPFTEQEAPAAEQGEPAAEPAPAAAVEAPETPAAAASAVPDEVVSGGTTVSMPALGESVTEGTVTRWLKAEGDQIAVDEPLLEVSTDKVDTEIPSPLAGTITKILVGEDETVPVGADLAI
ncbi:MAG TPA: biotin/lipoyl-containing protein, partial [Dermatophilaceae bacterium]